MPTKIPDGWIHHSSEVEQNAARFDDLCRLTEEVAYPTVRDALVREFKHTAATGAELLTEEAMQALKTLAADGAKIEQVDGTETLKAVEESLRQGLPEPDEAEFKQHTREVAQMMMSSWLEIIRGALLENPVLLLSHLLLPHTSSRIEGWMESIRNRIGRSEQKLPDILIDAVAWSAINEEDATQILAALHQKLFATRRLVDLPFELALIGAPDKPVFAATRHFFAGGALLPYPDVVPAPTFVGVAARRAEQHLSEHLASTQYGSMAMKAASNLQTRVAARVHQAIKID